METAADRRYSGNTTEAVEKKQYIPHMVMVLQIYTTGQWQKCFNKLCIFMCCDTESSYYY
jgi:hypothetical protein